MNDVGASSKLKKSRKGTAASILSGVTDGGRGNVGSSRGRSIRLPTFIDYNSSSAASTAATTTNGYSYLDSEDDKHLKYRHRLKKRVIKYANSDSTGALGTLLRSAIRAGILERSFWKRTVVVALLLVTGLLFLLWRSYETHIEIAFYPRSWIRRSILPVPPLSQSCFAPSSPTMQRYNTTLANAPKHLLLNPGISMRLGIDCYSFASTIPSTPLQGQTLPEHTIYHLYWRSDLQPLGPRQTALIKSILTSQDAQRSRVVLWTNDPDKLYQDPQLVEIKEYATRQYTQSLVDATDPSTSTTLPRFSVEGLDLHALAKGTAMDSNTLLESALDKRAWIDGDLVRVLVLYNHGGVWVDMDTLILRDIRPLTEQEFVTQWDCYDKVYSPLNGAIMHFHQSSPYLCEMLHIMATDPPPRQGTTDWGALLYHKLHRRLLASSIKPFTILPYCLTDARSCRLDNRLPDPFVKDDRWIRSEKGLQELKYKIDSVFSIHLHNQWNKMWPKGGWVDRLVMSKVEERWKKMLLGQ